MVMTYALNLKLKSHGNAKKLQKSKQVNCGGDNVIQKSLDVEFSTKLWWKNDDKFFVTCFRDLYVVDLNNFQFKSTNKLQEYLGIGELILYYIRLYKYDQPDVIKYVLFGFYLEYREYSFNFIVLQKNIIAFIKMNWT